MRWVVKSAIALIAIAAFLVTFYTGYYQGYGKGFEHGEGYADLKANPDFQSVIEKATTPAADWLPQISRRPRS